MMSGVSVGLTFVPHLTPIIRGIHATLYGRIKSEADFQGLFERAYAERTVCRRSSRKIASRNAVSSFGQYLPDCHPSSPGRRYLGDPLGHRQSGQGRCRSGGTKHEPDVWPGRIDRAMPTPAVTLRIRKFRRRFGITAPRVVVRTHLSWPWYAGGAALILLLFLVIIWLFLQRGETGGMERELDALRTQVRDLDGELLRLRSTAGTEQSAVQMERSTQQQLTSRIKGAGTRKYRLEGGHATVRASDVRLPVTKQRFVWKVSVSCLMASSATITEHFWHFSRESRHPNFAVDCKYWSFFPLPGSVRRCFFLLSAKMQENFRSRSGAFCARKVPSRYLLARGWNPLKPECCRVIH